MTRNQRLHIRSPGSPFWRVNEPEGFTAVPGGTVNFSQDYPSSFNGGIGVIGSTNWQVEGPRTNITRISDATAIKSPPDVWEVLFPAGSYGGGVVGQGPGTGFGDFYINVKPALDNVPFSEFYACIGVKWSDSYVPHPVGDKWLEFSISGTQIIMPNKESGEWLRPHNLLTGWLPTDHDNTPIPNGEWHIIEFYCKPGNPGIVTVWMNGAVRGHWTDANVPYNPGGFQEFYMRNFRGGGGEIIEVDGHVYYDEFYLSVAAV